MNKYTFLFLSLTTLVSCNNKADKPLNIATTIKGDVKVSYNTSYNYKYRFTRHFHKRLKFIRSIQTNQDNLLYLQQNGPKIIGLNYKESKLMFLDTSLSILGEFGSKGKAFLKDNSGIMFFDADDNKIQLFDFGSQMIKSYSIAKDSLIAYQKLNSTSSIYRFAALNKDYYLLTEGDDTKKDMLFKIYHYPTRSVMDSFSLNQILNIGKPEKYPRMVYDGRFIISKQSNQLIYFCSFTGLFIAFDKIRHTVLYSAKTIDQTPVPSADYVQISPGYKSLELKPNLMFFNSGWVTDKYLYLLNNINPRHEYVTDLYDLADKGKYVTSIAVPNMEKGGVPISVLINEQSLFVLYEDHSIAKYQII